jgi:hypothetical protein
VFDPFTGTGTSGEVALKLGRHFIGVELYDDYAQIAEERCRKAHALRCEYEAENQMTPSPAAFVGTQDDARLDEGGCEMVDGAACS